MVLQKRLDYGFNGYQVPPIPRATRSARRRSVIWRKGGDNQMCAFELLASVAGKLLLEGESSSSSKDNTSLEKVNIKKEKQNEEGTMLERSCNRGSKERGFFISELVSQAPVLNNCSSELPRSRNGILSGPSSVITTCDFSDTIALVEQLGNGEVFSSCKSGGNRVSDNVKVATDSKDGICSSEFPVLGDRKKTSTLVCSDNSVELTLSRNHVPCGSLPPANRDDVKLGSRDDDENPLRSTSNKAFRPSLRMRDQRVKKLLASKYWELNSKSSDKQHLDADVESSFKHQRSLRDYPYKKRKLYDCGSVGNSDGGKSSDGMCTSLARGYSGVKSSNGLCTTPNGDASRYCLTLPTAHSTTGQSTFAVDEQASFRPGDPHVKLKIKSFRVPELFIEIPETATIGSLKRTVMEAVTRILGDGLCVGVVFQGKKVGDDKKTLLQTGISHNNKLDALGFTLEPNPSQDPPLLGSEAHTQPYCDTPRPLKRYPAARSIAHAVVQAGPANILNDEAGTNLINFIGSSHDLDPSRANVSLEKHAADSRALVAAPGVNLETFAAVPVRKPKRSEAARRRIRRPFSVTEVEALVQAVEKLGTGRWRDVKLRAFDNAKHRTYVDLKDKWKTLVHTARISPQQRRGEPVPQELLDRVLTAHAYWSQQQAKQQMKQHPETCLLL
ncbi:PREDICTED: telomere repeat-binding protein 5-like [Ipomoea nil]|uniref:telomere repeat-binding protein 5-like n=1 Tax=Ipomoea nil TaxID=35883 RepID=UPI000901DCF0|nr:PREDICTED: telomere repeat-binding protein 5-like [Ipomoea nil]